MNTTPRDWTIIVLDVNTEENGLGFTTCTSDLRKLPQQFSADPSARHGKTLGRGKAGVLMLLQKKKTIGGMLEHHLQKSVPSSLGVVKLITSGRPKLSVQAEIVATTLWSSQVLAADVWVQE